MEAWRNLRIGHKLLMGYLTLFIVSTTAGNFFIYLSVGNTIEKNIESELKNSTTTLFNMVSTSVSVAIKNHLRAVAEKNREILRHFYDAYTQGELTEKEAKERASAVLRSQTIGTSGYLYCLNSKGVVTVHPKKGMLGTDVSGFEFVRDQIRGKEGYIEYSWKNPTETDSRPKALYMSYFKPWDWIVSVSSYRNEFRDLIKIEDFRQGVLSLKFGKSGYSYVTDGRGNTVLHPKMEGINIFHREETPSEFFKIMLEKKEGKMIYSWKNPGEPDFRKKMVFYSYMPELDWIVASSSYMDEFYAPLKTMRMIFIITTAIVIILAIPVTLKISASITTRLGELMAHLESSGTSRDFTPRIISSARDEIGKLFFYFNVFMERLERYSASLNQEIAERKDMEKALRGSEERYREAQEMGDTIRRKIGQDLHDDLCPHLIGIQGFCTVLRNNIKTSSPGDAALAERIGALIHEATDKARALSKGLCPTHLVAHGLESALGELCRTVGAFSGKECLLVQNTPLVLDENREMHIYYMIQEAVYNAVKHGNAETIIITLDREADTPVIFVDDDGSGMPDSPDDHGVGLKIMVHRMARANCSVSWETNDPRGTRVRIALLKEG
ncbi:MAG: cache domain-containing protein [Desulfobacterium sp.]|nr:cache domain-containing protein [Desulfobacterium sp.]